MTLLLCGGSNSVRDQGLRLSGTELEILVTSILSSMTVIAN